MYLQSDSYSNLFKFCCGGCSPCGVSHNKMRSALFMLGIMIMHQSSISLSIQRHSRGLSKLFSSIVAEIISTSKPQYTSQSDWREAALNHKEKFTSMLYPKGVNLKERQHMVNDHPIYNFLHRYYRYNKEELLKYSPGMHIQLEVCNDADSDLLSSKFLTIDRSRGTCHFSAAMFREQLTLDGKLGSTYIRQNYNVLVASSKKTAFFGCYGFHEWAMLYSGAKNQSQPLKKHQEKLPLRISQDTLDHVVEAGQLRCTHFDAWRFFHPQAQPLNIINPLTRSNQAQFEQPGCIHANMDLFKYAYQLYPLVSSQLLLQSLEVALAARIIDMRASPYDVSAFEECQEPLCVETADGRRRYAEEQEKLADMAAPVRQSLLQVYAEALGC